MSERDIEEAQRARQDAAHWDDPHPDSEVYGVPYTTDHIIFRNLGEGWFIECECNDNDFMVTIEDGDSMTDAFNEVRDHITAHRRNGDLYL